MVPASLEGPPPGNVTAQSATSPGHIDTSAILRVPDQTTGYIPRIEADKVLFSGDDGGGIAISFSGADLRDRWTFNYWYPETLAGAPPDFSCPMQILPAGDPGNPSPYLALVMITAVCSPPPGVSPVVRAFIGQSTCPCSSAGYLYTIAVILRGYAAADRTGAWRASVDFQEGSTGMVTPAVVSDRFYLERTPLVAVVHGWAADCSTMATLQSSLARELAIPSRRIQCFSESGLNGWDTREGVTSGASALQSWLRVFAATDPTQPEVDIVAHSMGGLLARWYQQKLYDAQTDPQIGSISMLGTPNGGMWIAGWSRFLCPSNAAWYRVDVKLGCKARDLVNDVALRLGFPDLASQSLDDMRSTRESSKR